MSGNSGTNSQWVVTDDQGNILGLPPSFDVVDFDGAGAGTCLVWHLSYEDGLEGVAMGNNAMTDLMGCYSLSNSISVVRSQPVGGVLEGGPFEFCVGDGVADNIGSDQIVLSGNSGTNSQWVVTDDQGNILGLPTSFDVVDFDGAGAGTCLVWHLSYEDGMEGVELGNNIMTDLMGCYSLSNSIPVNRIICPQGGIVINELNANNRIEIKNTGSDTVDISSYFICNFPFYNQLSSLSIECGNDLILEPGELVTVISNFNNSETDGEMGLYLNSNYGNSNSIIDYVEWGSTGHQRSSVAVDAGIWTTGDFVPAFDAGMSIEYDGMGDSSADWMEDNFSYCMENFTGPTEIESLAYKVYPNPANEFILLEVLSSRDSFGQMLVFDNFGRLIIKRELQFDNKSDMRINVSDLMTGQYFIKLISHKQSKVHTFFKAN